MGGGLQAYSVVRLVIMGSACLLYFASFSSAIVGEWTIGMVPPAVMSLWLFVSAGCWHHLTEAEKNPAQMILLVLVIIMTVFAAVFGVLGGWMLLASLRGARCRKGAKDMTLVVLGCRLVDGKPGGIMLRRLRKAKAWLDRCPEMKCILAGGNIQPGEPTEAQVMRDYLVEAGVGEDRLILEDSSTTTYENIRFCRRIVQERQLPERLAVVTDRFHQLRVRLICRDNQIKSVSVNSEVPAMVLLQYWSREVLCLLEKWVRRL